MDRVAHWQGSLVLVTDGPARRRDPSRLGQMGWLRFSQRTTDPRGDSMHKAYSVRAGEGLQLGPDWTLHIRQFHPYPLAMLEGPPGKAQQGLHKGLSFDVGPCRVLVSELTVDGRKRARLIVAAPDGVEVRPLAREAA